MLVKTAVLMAVAVCASATKLSGEQCSNGHCESDEVSLLQERTKLHKKEGRAAIVAGAKSTKSKDGHDFGNSDCPCIGIDDTTGVIFGISHITYPADVGAHCSKWDGKNKSCIEDWCEEKWCYVDPCNCKNVPELPQPSTYLGDAKYQGHSIYYSYATCGSKDTYTKKDTNSSREDTINASCSKDIDEKEWGKKDCQCQGFTPEKGVVQVSVSGKTLEYEADYGANCKDWDATNDVKCMGDSPPDYCTEKWCYVADDCGEDAETSKIMPDATADGKPVKYSYATCGGTNKYDSNASNASNSSNSSNASAADNSSTAANYGESGCQCVGIDGADGSVNGDVDGKKVSFPADYGAHCDTWDKTDNPECTGSDAGDWCSQKWCYVDPCTCDGTKALPKPSDYLKDAEYQGHGLYFSYSTCGSKDSYSADDSEDNRKKTIKDTCATSVDNSLWGSKDCLCTGITPVDGEVKVKSGDEYAADYGANCQAWDQSNDPKCKGDSPPDYCAEKWCYVNKDDCSGVSPKPKPSLVLPDASDAEGQLYFSYSTCGGTDKFSGYSAGSKAEMKQKSKAVQLSAGVLSFAAVFFTLS